MATIKKFEVQKKVGKDPLTAGMTDPAKAHFTQLESELKELGVDTVKFHRAIVFLAKDLALEEMCEREIIELGSVCYAPPSGASQLLKEHPSAKSLHTVRNRIYMTMKSMGLLPNTKEAVSSDKGVSEFAAIG